ncbi:hypothetical protein GCM10010170_063190 [Dactylosporangium salmoneum]|uniref:Uncharacterized protein n=1 Tax=Dactylosporangium salmoneum TaxID=53361 RepID=A0ABP5TYP3_9ACTN
MPASRLEEPPSTDAAATRSGARWDGARAARQPPEMDSLPPPRVFTSRPETGQDFLSPPRLEEPPNTARPKRAAAQGGTALTRPDNHPKGHSAWRPTVGRRCAALKPKAKSAPKNDKSGAPRHDLSDLYPVRVNVRKVAARSARLFG